MNKQILIPAKTRTEMLHTFKVGRNTLRRALMYEVNSPKAKMLRAAALERGGLIYTDEVRELAIRDEDVVTEFDHTAGFMYQTFFKKVFLALNMRTGDTSLSVDGEKIVEFGNMGVAKWANVLYCVQQVDNQLNR